MSHTKVYIQQLEIEVLHVCVCTTSKFTASALALALSSAFFAGTVEFALGIYGKMR